MQIDVKNVEKNFDTFRVLKNINIKIESGKVFGLLGPNGAGKTTLIRILNHITAPDSGEVLFDGLPLRQQDTENIGYLPEERGLYKKMKVGEQAIFLAQLKGLSQKEAVTRLHQWFKKFQIDDWWDKKVEELSKGMQQKIQFIVTVVHQPKLLIFDEPFSGFDPVNAELLKKEILELKKNGATIVFSTHNMSSVEELCDDIALINHGEVILSGSVRDIKQQFKENIFEVVLSTQNEINDKKDVFEIIEQKTNQFNETTVLLKKDDKISTNELINNILAEGNIISFNEKLPSMNEIFINQVQKK